MMQNSEIRAAALQAAVLYYDVKGYAPYSEELFTKADEFAKYIDEGKNWKPRLKVNTPPPGGYGGY
jgi:hypothetical protein